MSKEVPLSIAERDFIVDALRGGVRLDGRGLDQLRPLNVSFGEEYGHVNVQLGKTRWVLIVSVGIRLECFADKCGLTAVSLSEFLQKSLSLAMIVRLTAFSQ